MEATDLAAEAGTASQGGKDKTSDVNNNNDNNNEAPRKNLVKKRTKTGCMTCRRRRIKCDEGKPTCSNCIKSKRVCEGYNQRVIFKDPMGFHGGLLHGPPMVYPPHHPHGFYMPRASQGKIAASQGPLPAIAPKPRPMDFHALQAGNHGVPYQQIPPDGRFVQNPMNYEMPRSSDMVPGPSGFPGHGAWPPGSQMGFDSSGAARGFEGDLTNPGQVPAGTVTGVSTGMQAMQPELGLDGMPVPVTASSESTDPSGASMPHPPGLIANALRQPRPEDASHSQMEVDYEISEDEQWTEDEDDGYSYGQNSMAIEHDDLGMALARGMQLGQPNDVLGLHQRTFRGTSDNILSSYTASASGSLLNDSHAAAAFRHFIQTTGLCISLYERHPYDPSPILLGAPVPKSRRHIWTYTFPVLSFRHPALLHAILALGSLQMAKYDNTPPTAALRHYHRALTRVKKNIRGVSRRTHPATLAATLLLGYFEVWSSDHEKWCKHLMGSRLLLKEIPFPEMTRAFLAAKQQKRRRLEVLVAQQMANPFLQVEDSPEQELYSLQDPDVDFIREISGRQRLAYELPPRFDDMGGHDGILNYTDSEIESYQQLSDLFWWYAKMDTYQSVLSGTKPFMDYDLWTQVQPRGPLGRIDSIYGTYDHLMLLLGRVASFASRDISRKRRQMASQGGPPGGMRIPPVAGIGSQHGPPLQGRYNQPSPPTFPGIIPRGNVEVSTTLGFSPPREASPQSDGADDVDLEMATAAAMAEWHSILDVFAKFQARLSEDFRPLDPDNNAAVGARASPFGPVRMYRTFSIAGIWMNLYMGLIVLHRVHPTMPPVAMMAAGLKAKETWNYAMEIGRIAAGLSDDVSRANSINTIVASAFIESCFCLFVAGIQYREDPQRHWVVRRLMDISRLTGWQSARQIAEGCESAWTKAAALGRGPPYQRPGGLLFPVEPSSIWVSPRRIDRAIREHQALDRDGEGGGAGAAGGGEQKSERRLVLHKSEQAHYALGILGVEQDLERLDLQENP